MLNNLNIKSLPESERPYEKCLANGPGALSCAELLAVIIRNGTTKMRSTELAQHVLNLCETRGGISALCNLSHHELKQISGIGDVKAIEIMCAAELAKRISKSTPKKKQFIAGAADVVDYYMETLRHEPVEHLMVMMLDTKHHLIRECEISKGTVNYTILNPREIFAEALKFGAVSIVMVHNHPSGDPSPSQEDIEMTKMISQLGNMLGIPLLDHIIIGNHDYESLSVYIEE